MTSLRQRMTEDMQVRNLALNTQSSYLQQVTQFARYFKRSPEQLGPEEIRDIKSISPTNESWRPVCSDRCGRPEVPVQGLAQKEVVL